MMNNSERSAWLRYLTISNERPLLLVESEDRVMIAIFKPTALRLLPSLVHLLRCCLRASGVCRGIRGPPWRKPHGKEDRSSEAIRAEGQPPSPGYQGRRGRPPP